MSIDFEPVIGLEVHAQLSTDSKIFCSCRARLPEGKSVADEASNANTCPICAGHPGTLPVLNKKALAMTLMTGLATHCEIRQKSVFARKNYFYPDLPKGYQISQYDEPLCENGWLEITPPEGKGKKIKIQRIHMEEDAGKNIHMSGFSLVNLNRAGIPLMEIVSAPDMHDPLEAGAYLRALHAIVTYLGVCDGNMQEGNFRCDANVSVRPKGSKTLGTRTEIKNVNSFRFVEKAIEYEIARQIGVIQSGGRVVQETRLYDSAKNVTLSMRSKEDAHDYRYFPDPDLLPITVDSGWLKELRNSLPELPQQKLVRLIKEYGLTPNNAEALIARKSLADFFSLSMESQPYFSPTGKDAKSVRAIRANALANFLNGEITRLMNEENIDQPRAKITPSHLSDLVRLTVDQTISSAGAKRALSESWKNGLSIPEIVDREGLKQVSDSSELEAVIDAILKQYPAQVQEYRSGKDKLIGFFVGQAMKASGGKANPTLLQDLFTKKLKG